MWTNTQRTLDTVVTQYKNKILIKGRIHCKINKYDFFLIPLLILVFSVV